MPTVLAILADGFEEIEAITPIDLLRRAEVEVTIASLNDNKHVTGKCGITLHADTIFAELTSHDFDCLLLPGGPHVKGLRSNNAVLKLVRDHYATKRLTSAICAAPAVLHDAGVLAGHRYTAHFSVADELPNIMSDQKVVHDGPILTSRGAGTALNFGLALVEQLCGGDKAREIAKSICM